jgi:cell division protease FtsH
MMVTRWGMSEQVGMVQLAPRDNPYLGGQSGFTGPKPFSERTAELVDAEVQRIIGESHDQAKRLLAKHREREILEVTGLPPAPPLDEAIAAATTSANPG